MPKRIVAVDYNKCRPGRCGNGVCVAASACPLGLIKQEAPYEVPMQTSHLCKNCAKCVRACPLEAVKLKP